MTYALVALAVALCAAPIAEAGSVRTKAQWGGSDFPFSCDTVRAWRTQINGMSAATKAELARQFNITRKQRRQAMTCLKGRD